MLKLIGLIQIGLILINLKTLIEIISQTLENQDNINFPR